VGLPPFDVWLAWFGVGQAANDAYQGRPLASVAGHGCAAPSAE